MIILILILDKKCYEINGYQTNHYIYIYIYIYNVCWCKCFQLVVKKGCKLFQMLLKWDGTFVTHLKGIINHE
jgi:hypothetical protein